MDLLRFCDWLPVGPDARVHVCHGIPDRAYACEDGMPGTAEMADVVARATGLHVQVGSWRDSTAGDCLEADVMVAPEDFDEVLARLARASAQTYWDRYHDRLGPDDTDYLEAAFAADLNQALHHCGLSWSRLPAGPHYERYSAIVHEVCDQLASRIH